MEIRFTQTGDPWHDWGLCVLYDVLRHLPPTVGLTEMEDDGFRVCTDTAEEFADAIHSVFASVLHWNQLHPRFEEGKRIERCRPRTEGGRRVPGEKYDPKVTPGEWKAAGCHGEPHKVARNRCQQIASLPLKPDALSALLDPGGGKGSLREVAQQAAVSGEKAKITQGANPLVAKHHANARVRDPAASNHPRSDTHACLLACWAATLSPWKPFEYNVKTRICTVMLPDNLSLSRLYRLYTHLRASGALVHPDKPNGMMYRNLRLEADGIEARLLVLLDSLQSSLAGRTITGGLFPEEVRELNDWMAVNFGSGTTVTVGAIHRIEVPGSVFPLLEAIPGPACLKEPRDVRFIPDCLSGIRHSSIPVQSHLARALFRLVLQPRDGWRAFSNCSLLLYKHADRAAMSGRTSARLLSHFLAHFAQEMIPMSQEQMDACRKIGELAGSAFSGDVTVISRLHNSSSPEDLRQNLKLLTFRLFKAANGDKASELWHISKADFDTVLDLCETPEWQTASDTISLFASLAAFNKNLNKQKG